MNLARSSEGTRTAAAAAAAAAPSWRALLAAPFAGLDGPTRAIGLALVLLLALGGLLHAEFLSPSYLLLQLHNGAFLGIVAAGAMLVILLGHIDLSVPWTLTVAAMVSTAVAHGQSELGPLAGLAAGAAIGLVNGLGVAVLRVPSLIWTLAVNTILLGAVALHAGQTAGGDAPSPLAAWLGAGRSLGVVSNAVLVWLALSLLVAWLLRRSVFGRCLVAVGTRESAAWLSGVPTRAVIVAGFVGSGLCSALAGVLLAGYAGQSYARMGDPYLLPGIAAVVVGGTSILGGRGRYAGTVAGVLLITLVGSMLAVMRVPEAVKQICWGLLIAGMVIWTGRRDRR